MPAYLRIPYDPNEGQWILLRASSKTFSAREVRRSAVVNSSARQVSFEALLRQLSNYVGDNTVPVFISTPTKGEVRLDRGCIGHAVANGVLEATEDSSSGYVEFVTLRRSRSV